MSVIYALSGILILLILCGRSAHYSYYSSISPKVSSSRYSSNNYVPTFSFLWDDYMKWYIHNKNKYNYIKKC